MSEGYAIIQKGRAAVVEGGGSLMTHSAGSVTTQSVAINNVMASKPNYFT